MSAIIIGANGSRMTLIPGTIVSKELLCRSLAMPLACTILVTKDGRVSSVLTNPSDEVTCEEGTTTLQVTESIDVSEDPVVDRHASRFRQASYAEHRQWEHESYSQEPAAYSVLAPNTFPPRRGPSLLSSYPYKALPPRGTPLRGTPTPGIASVREKKRKLTPFSRKIKIRLYAATWIPTRSGLPKMLPNPTTPAISFDYIGTSLPVIDALHRASDESLRWFDPHQWQLSTKNGVAFKLDDDLLKYLFPDVGRRPEIYYSRRPEPINDDLEHEFEEDDGSVRDEPFLAHVSDDGVDAVESTTEDKGCQTDSLDDLFQDELQARLICSICLVGQKKHRCPNCEHAVCDECFESIKPNGCPNCRSARFNEADTLVFCRL